MPKTELTDSEVFEILARFMGYIVRGESQIEVPPTRGILYWNPLDDLNVIYQLQLKLTRDQRKAYIRGMREGFELIAGPGALSETDINWIFRNLSARDCARAMAEMVKGEKDAA